MDSHLADTGEDPGDAFGSPRSYAAALTKGRQRQPWWHLAISALPGAVAGWLVAAGALALLLDQRYAGRSGWLWVFVGLLIGVPSVIWAHRRSTRVTDPRTGADLVGGWHWGLVVWVGPPLVLIAVVWGAIRIFG